AIEYPRIYYYSLFPNVLLSVHHDYVMLHTLWPLAVDRTLIHCYWLFNEKSLNNAAIDPAHGIRFLDMTNKEDWHMSERTQLGVVSRVYRPGPYSRRENCPAAFDAEVLRALGHTPEH